MNCPLLMQQKQSLGKKLKIDLQRTISHGIDRVSRLYSQRYISILGQLYRLLIKLVLLFIFLDIVFVTFLKIFSQNHISIFPDSLHSCLKTKTRQKRMLLIFKANKQRSEHCQLQHVSAQLRRHKE